MCSTLAWRYVEREGTALVPHNHLEEGFELGQWVTVQRAARDKHDFRTIGRERRFGQRGPGLGAGKRREQAPEQT